MIVITLKANADRITQFEVKPVGIPGQACLLTTAAIAKLNPQAIIEPTDEWNDEQVPDIQNHLTLGGG